MFKRTLAFVLAGFAMGAPAGAAPVLTGKAAGPERQQLAKQVHDLFEAKCVDCHGPELPKPKGKFGYVLDLERVGANPDYVVKGKPEESEIYRMVLNNEMPGEDSKVAPLTPQECEAVRRWILAGAPHELPAPPIAALPAVVEEKAVTQPRWRRTLAWVGKLHPVTTHFPVALMFVALFTEGLAWWTRRESWFQSVRLLVVLAALSGVLAGSLGWINGVLSSYGSGKEAWVYHTHKWLGTSTILWAILCGALVLGRDLAEGSAGRRRFRGALMVGATLVGVSGFLGSALIYGLDHYAW